MTRPSKGAARLAPDLLSALDAICSRGGSVRVAALGYHTPAAEVLATVRLAVPLRGGDPTYEGRGVTASAALLDALSGVPAWAVAP